MMTDSEFKQYMVRLAPLIARRLHAPFSYVGAEPCGKHVIHFSDGSVQATIAARPLVREGRHVLLLEVGGGGYTTHQDVVNFRPLGLHDHDALAFAQAVTRNALRRIP